MKYAFKVIAAIVAGSAMLASTAGAYEVPSDNSRAKYFYVFGPEGDPLMGAEGEHTLELYVDVPESASDEVWINIFDPDTSGKRDWRKDPGTNEWDTETEFTVFGKDKLDSKTFTTEGDESYHRFGPYSKEKGEKVDGAYRFKLVAKGTKGDDEHG